MSTYIVNGVPVVSPKGFGRGNAKLPPLAEAEALADAAFADASANFERAGLNAGGWPSMDEPANALVPVRK